MKSTPLAQNAGTSLLRALPWGLLLVGLGQLTGPVNAQTVSFGSLLDEMVNRERLARWPDPEYTCRQASSYDRASVAADKPGWFANWDRSRFVRVEETLGRKEYVLMDQAGPGAVVRFWATWHGPDGGKFSNGTLRVYLDGQEQPTISGPLAEIIDGGGLTGPPLSQGVSPETAYDHRGHNLYLPIPYGRQCKITYETSVTMADGEREGEALYYQVNYRTYADDVRVETFCMEDLEVHQAHLQEVQEQLVSSDRVSAQGSYSSDLAGRLAAGESKSIGIHGPGAIARLAIRLDADDVPQALRSTILSLTFDDKPSIWCPLGSFFGTGSRIRPHQTWYSEVQPDGTMASSWVMPFAASCQVRLINLGEQDVEVKLAQVKLAPWHWDDRSMHFHATWHQLSKVATGGAKTMTGEGALDVNYVSVDGQGVYVGDSLELFNGANSWWGEGDEKIFVDNEAFPSHFGTGTEDYYGYAWCEPALFQAPFHAQPDGGGNWFPAGTVNSRYRSLDAIPFRSRIQFDMELWHWADTHVNFAPTTFWYAKPGARCNVEPSPETAAQAVARKRSDIVEVMVVEGALEGEALEVLERTGGTAKVQSGDHGWSAYEQLWWRDGGPGDRLVLQFPVAEAGRYRVVANLTKASDYAIVRLTINGQQTDSQTLDRFYPTVALDAVDLGVFDLSLGTNQLTVEVVGANEQALPRFMFGLDYLKLVPAAK